MAKIAALAAGLLVLAGCYFGKKKEDRSWDPNAVSRIEPGKTTKAEVLRLLGPPREIARLLESEAYLYSCAVEKTTGTFLLVVNLTRSDRQSDSIAVIINRQDVVTAVGSRFAANEAAYGPPWK